MPPLYADPHFTLRFSEARLISRFHLEGVEAGRQVTIIGIHPGTGERLGPLSTAAVGDGGWVELISSIIVQAGEAFVAVLDPE